MGFRWMLIFGYSNLSVGVIFGFLKQKIFQYVLPIFWGKTTSPLIALGKQLAQLP